MLDGWLRLSKNTIIFNFQRSSKIEHAFNEPRNFYANKFIAPLFIIEL